MKKHKDLIGLVLNALNLEDEDLLLKIFGTLTELSEVKKILKPHLPNIVEKAILISANKDLTDNLRQVTLLLLQLISENYVKSMIKSHGLNFVDKIIEVCFTVAAEPKEDHENSEDPIPFNAIQTLYSYAMAVPNEKVFPIFQKYL